MRQCRHSVYCAEPVERYSTVAFHFTIYLFIYLSIFILFACMSKSFIQTTLISSPKFYSMLRATPVLRTVLRRIPLCFFWAEIAEQFRHAWRQMPRRSLIEFD